jgi:hypothetical protein
MVSPCRADYSTTKMRCGESREFLPIWSYDITIKAQFLELEAEMSTTQLLIRLPDELVH